MPLKDPHLQDGDSADLQTIDHSSCSYDVEIGSTINKINSLTNEGLDFPTTVTTKKSSEDLNITRTESTEIYRRFSPSRKHVIVGITAFSALLAPFSTTCILPGLPEIASDYDTTGEVIALVNAAFLGSMAISPCWWGPMSQIYGRRPIYIGAAALFAVSSLGVSLGPNLVSFIIFRILEAFAGCAFLAVGAGTIGDIYHPIGRSTAMV